MIFRRHVLAYDAPAAPERTATILEALGLEPSSEPALVTERAKAWCLSVGIEMSMEKRGVPASDLGAMAKEAAGIRRLLDNNPRPIGESDILAIYHAAQ